MKLILLPLALAMFAAVEAFALDPVLKFTMTKANGAPVTYEFLTPGESGGQTNTLTSEDPGALQQKAGVAAMAWAKQFYGARDVYLRSVELKQSAAVPYYLATFDGEVAGTRQVFFAVVLPSGGVIQPVEIPGQS